MACPLRRVCLSGPIRDRTTDWIARGKSCGGQREQTDCRYAGRAHAPRRGAHDGAGRWRVAPARGPDGFV